MREPDIARSELIVGGQKSGKSRRAQDLAQAWLAADAQHRSVLIATAVATDDEMRERIARHQADRARQLPHMVTVEEPLALAQCITRHSRSDTLLVVDCLTLWWTNLTWPGHRVLLPPGQVPQSPSAAADALLAAIADAPGPLVLVSNEIGLGVIPMGREVRQFVDALGSLNQRVAAACARATFMAAGLPLTLKATACT
ncbi:MAG: bifunctional adenosylcobinamide kinase/adenosylcobinamide-phosphate guanylyltransferase [Rhodoferax sp.]|jgi:adenosylcobinamide kinase/adenosylcobinamide-phosphate guanylyltransferase|nr:bifunctional adenosylcobinamide kinase/adenosylcobinamide-phosphate guanylyltransferase [Rhodoferax sp.]